MRERSAPFGTTFECDGDALVLDVEGSARRTTADEG
jgi:hypothetical protein